MATKRTYIRLNTGLLPHAMLLTVMLVGCFTALAEETEDKKILTEGKRWEYIDNNLHGLEYYERTRGTKYMAEVIGDTVIYSKPAKKLLIKYEHPDKEAFKDKPKTGEYIKVFIEENGRVYSQDDSYQQVYVDMNIEDNKAFGVIPVEHEDYIESPMGKLKRVYFTSLLDNKDVYHPLAMIEGVGSSNSFVGQDLFATDGGNHTRMTAFYYNDELVFTEEDFSPFPVGVEEIEVEKAAAGCDDAPYYDLMGQRVKNPVPGSILIRNGCKVVYR